MLPGPPGTPLAHGQTETQGRIEPSGQFCLLESTRPHDQRDHRDLIDYL